MASNTFISSTPGRRPDYTGRVSVPVLWDRERQTIVNNESPEIIRMLNAAFEEVGATGPDYYPAPLRPTIDAVNDRVFEHVNNGVYKAGFARTQEAYDEAVTALFETLDALDERLSRQRYLAGEAITEADLRLFTTLVRFDPVYVGHFKCNLRRLVDYANLWPYTRELYQHPGIAPTVDFYHIKQHYYGSHESVNPTGIVPKGRSSTGTSRTAGADRPGGSGTMAVGSARCRTARASSTAGRAHPDRSAASRRPHHPAPCSALAVGRPGFESGCLSSGRCVDHCPPRSSWPAADYLMVVQSPPTAPLRV